MDITAQTKFCRLSPSKARGIARLVQGKKVAEALKVVDFSTKKAAFLIGKTLKSAIANAENNEKLVVDDLVVKLAVVDEGPRMKRYWARARGSVSPIKRRLANIKVVLTDGKNE